MAKRQINLRQTATMFATMLLAVVASTIFIGGCTDTLKEDVLDNEKPLVFFVNIPPEGQQFSRNPLVYWYGTDRDGLIDYYRIHVATDDEVGSQAPEEYIASVNDTSWMYIDVDPAESEPQTGQTVPMSANVLDPVNSYVPQWVFLQAFDMEGASSEVAYRLFFRNDNPPQTQLYNIIAADNPFVNAVNPGGIITGIRLRWSAEDPIDFPSDPPPFEYQWRLYGPYTTSEISQLSDSFFTEVFISSDGFVYRIGDTIIRCDTSFVDTAVAINCDTTVVVPGMGSSALGAMEDYFRVDDSDFVGSMYDRVEDSSFNGIDPWVLNTTDTIYNVFKTIDVDTTSQMKFILWVRSRDDAFVPDPAPAFDTFSVINPRFERDVLVLDFAPVFGFTHTSPRNWPQSSYPDSFHVSKFWKEAITAWDPNIGAGFDVNQDWQQTRRFNVILPMNILLNHKVVILHNDEIVASGITDSKIGLPLYKAIDAGVNMWATMRAAISGGPTQPPTQNVIPPFAYQFYFAVRKMAFSGSFCLGDTTGFTPCALNARIEDFVGAYSLDTQKWPDLTVVPEYLKSRLRYQGLVRYNDAYPALPEVNWSEARYGAEVMYLYKSMYGAAHPLGRRDDFDFVMEGAPVGHRQNTGLFRTVHFNFTPIVLEPTSFQQLFDTVMNYLYDPSIATPVSEIRYPEAQNKLSVSEQRRRYWLRNEEAAREEGIDLTNYNTTDKAER